MVATKKQDNARPASSLGWFSTYDGNIIGGLLIGAGMTLSGACPGTVIPQVLTGITSGRYTALGGVTGGILFARLESFLKARQPADEIKETVSDNIGVSSKHTLLAFETMVISIVGTLCLLEPGHKSLLHPVAGGIAIGLSQLVSIVLTTHTLGVSGAYREAGRWFWYLSDQIDKTPCKQPTPPTRAMTFVLGMLTASWSITKLFTMPPQGSIPIPPLQALVGGSVMVFGASLAGGCTSGHGISGMSTFGLSSIISVASMFVGGIALASMIW